MPSTLEDKFLDNEIEVGLKDISYTIQVYDTPLGVRWLDALRDNLTKKRILEKNFCFLGYADGKRNLKYLVDELNQAVAQINSCRFDPPYEKYIHLCLTISSTVPSYLLE